MPDMKPSEATGRETIRFTNLKMLSQLFVIKIYISIDIAGDKLYLRSILVSFHLDTLK